jgi:23S rRNA (adenine2503-C2)-methyltransferase
MMKTLLGLNTEELCEVVQELGEPAYRGKQLAEWIYRRGARTFEEMTNLPDKLRASLSKGYVVGRSEVVAVQRSQDGTVKLLLELNDGAQGEIPLNLPLRKGEAGGDAFTKGEASFPLRKRPSVNLPLRKRLTIDLPLRKRGIKGDLTFTKSEGSSLVETVGIPYADRFSCCLSTQVGCPVGCVFCATGLGGFTRNLTAGEIVDQVLSIQEASGKRVDHAVFMGMGEPLLNYEATVKALRLLNEEMGIAMRHLTVSTVGFVPGIHRLAQEKLQATLAVSLHAPTDELRRRLIPGMKFSLNEIIEACRKYFEITGRRVTFEYCLLDGVNDGVEEARELARLLRGMNCHVNLIPYNPVAGLAYKTRSRERVRAFREVLEGAGVQVTQRQQRGADIDAACGQLKAKSQRPKAREIV